ncbi:ClpXP protease specificity-enhancing factor SspB [Candidatus Fokinia crypta]|uniref:Stringent starvation protein B n=1 Tax=Candidatus Fokinia crypta TaxID=1920990 RepID=A0ABZ0UU05_9RICK|nr:ClpXP protease specificity-enhancing factor SspB [Candidatus Fokinia cryptica]WPX97535.1 Putative stringent starvation protein B [Candidatus Fokinia cryptica]
MKKKFEYGKLYPSIVRLMITDVLKMIENKEDVLHFCINITCDIHHHGVEVPPVLKERYPYELKITLQHPCQDFKASHEKFSVTASFDELTEHVTIPLAALKQFEDVVAGISIDFEALRSADKRPANYQSNIDLTSLNEFIDSDGVAVLDARNIFGKIK